MLALASPVVRAQDASGGYVSRKEYEELKAEMLAMKRELASLKKAKRAESNQENPKSQADDDMHKEVATPAAPPQEPTLGTTNFHIAGYGVGMFEARNGSDSTFSATFNPIFLWELSPKLLFEGHLHIEGSGSNTHVELEYAQLTYLLTDYIALGAGEFLAPSNIFVERFEPAWINKLPDDPLAVYDGGILPVRSIGFQVRGGIPIGPTRVNYAFYVSNGPSLNAFDPHTAGTLDFNSYTDNNDDKAIGGRVGFLPIPGVEVGYGFETSKPGFQGTSFADLRALVQSVDLEITRDSDLLKGRINLFAQYAWSKVDHAVYDPDGSLGFGPLPFTAKRDGGYAEIAYRPTSVDVDFVRNLELIFRWDHLSRAPSGLGDPEETRWTLGLDYWLSPSTVVKAAYEWDQPHGERNRNALLLQVVAGF